MEVTKPTNSAMTGITLNVLEDFDDIKSRHKIGDELFQKGLKFAMLISEGKEKKLAYMIAFDEEDKHMANVRANQLARTKWCGSLIDRIICGNHILFADKHYMALSALFDIGMNGDSERNRVDALGKFIEHTKRPDTKVDTQININIGSDMLENLEAQLNALASKALMVTKAGEIVDCEVIK